jgi:hypothetical protein
MAAAQAVGGFEVWRPYNGSDGLRAYLYGIARPHPTEVPRTPTRGRSPTRLGSPRAAIIAGPDSLLWGFGLEGVTDEARRDELMGRAIDYLQR